MKRLGLALAILSLAIFQFGCNKDADVANMQNNASEQEVSPTLLKVATLSMESTPQLEMSLERNAELLSHGFTLTQGKNLNLDLNSIQIFLTPDNESDTDEYFLEGIGQVAKDQAQAMVRLALSEMGGSLYIESQLVSPINVMVCEAESRVVIGDDGECRYCQFPSGERATGTENTYSNY